MLQKDVQSAEKTNKSRPIRKTAEAGEAGSDMKNGKLLEMMNKDDSVDIFFDTILFDIIEWL